MRILHAFAVTVLLVNVGGAGQLQQTPVWSGSPTIPGAASDSRHGADPHANTAEMQERMEKVRQSERQRRMIADTNRLLALAAELKAETEQADKEGKGAKEPPSADVLKKAQEIEKLARSVKDRMKG